MQNNATKRTINLLADSLKNLLNVKEINKITINEITKDSGVNRQTFYILYINRRFLYICLLGVKI